jgi:hypothetical protein
MARTSQNSAHKAIENYVFAVEEQGGILTYYPVVVNNTLTTANITVTGTGTYAGPLSQGVTSFTHTPVAINSTASATAAQVASGYITSTSGAATTITLPTATALAAALPGTVGAGTVFDLYIDNTAGANTVTITPDSSMTKSQVAQVATYGVPTFGLFTVASGTSGIGCFRMVFSSGTALCIARVF